MIASLGEAAMGVVVLAYPPIVSSLLFAGEISGAGITMSRIAGIALIALGVACWPGNSAVQQLYGMLTYGTLAMLYLIYIGVCEEAVGVFLWPAIVAHAILAVLLFRVAFKERPQAVQVPH